MAFNDLKVKDQDFEGKNIQSIRENMVAGRAEELKRLFDAPAQEVLKEKINALIDYLCSTESASEIGTPELDENSGNTVAAQLSYIFREMQSLYAGSIADNSIEDVKLSDKEGQIKARVVEICKLFELLDQAPNNTIVRWSNEDEKRFEHILSEIGAFHVLDPEAGPKYGVLPVECGGTGAENAADAREKLGAVAKSGDTINGNLNIKNIGATSYLILVGPKGYAGALQLESEGAYVTRLYTNSAGNTVLYDATGDKSILRYDSKEGKITGAPFDFNTLGLAQVTTGVTIPNGSNLNDYTTVGSYAISSGSNAATMENIPYAGANCKLEVFSLGYSSGKMQLLTFGDSACRQYMRRYYNSAWGEWRRILTDDIFRFENGTLTITTT